MRDRLRENPIRATLLCVLLLACDSTARQAPEPPIEALPMVERFDVLSPERQSGAPGSPVESLPTVRVATANGRGIRDVPVTFVIDGRVAVPLRTDVDGLAQLPEWRLPATPGASSTVQAFSAMLPTRTFTATARSAAALRTAPPAPR